MPMQNIDDSKTPIQQIEELCNDVSNSLKFLEDPSNQYVLTAQNIRNFIGQVLGHVNGNPDVPGVNKVLVDSLVEIQRYIEDRPQNIKSSIVVLHARKSAYEECIEMLKAAESPVKKPDRAVTIERVMNQLDDSGELPRRKFGDRPEKLRDVRTAQELLRAGEIPEADI